MVSPLVSRTSSLRLVGVRILRLVHGLLLGLSLVGLLLVCWFLGEGLLLGRRELLGLHDRNCLVVEG